MLRYSLAMGKKIQVNVGLPEDIYKELQRQAAARDIPVKPVTLAAHLIAKGLQTSADAPKKDAK